MRRNGFNSSAKTQRRMSSLCLRVIVVKNRPRLLLALQFDFAVLVAGDTRRFVELVDFDGDGLFVVPDFESQDYFAALDLVGTFKLHFHAILFAADFELAVLGELDNTALGRPAFVGGGDFPLALDELAVVLLLLLLILGPRRAQQTHDRADRHESDETTEVAQLLCHRCTFTKRKWVKGVNFSGLAVRLPRKSQCVGKSFFDHKD